MEFWKVIGIERLWDGPFLSFGSKVKRRGNITVLTRKDAESIRWWVLHLRTNPGQCNNPKTSHLGRLGWKQYIGDDVTPRDMLTFIGLNLSTNVAMCKEPKCFTGEGDEYITVEPAGHLYLWTSPLFCPPA